MWWSELQERERDRGESLPRIPTKVWLYLFHAQRRRASSHDTTNLSLFYVFLILLVVWIFGLYYSSELVCLTNVLVYISRFLPVWYWKLMARDKNTSVDAAQTYLIHSIFFLDHVSWQMMYPNIDCHFQFWCSYYLWYAHSSYINLTNFQTFLTISLSLATTKLKPCMQ